MLSLPQGFLEKTDQELKDWIILTTIPEFSAYAPDIEWAAIDTENSIYKHEVKQNHYYFFDEEELPILGVSDMFISGSTDYINGHPYIGPYSVNGIKGWALQALNAKLLKPFSNFNYTFKFIPPNIIRILPGNPGLVVLEYERQHPDDLRKIPAGFNTIFKNLALADVMLWIGQIRSMYSNVSTPFGEIQIKGEELVAKGTEIKEKYMELLKEATIPPLVIDIG